MPMTDYKTDIREFVVSNFLFGQDGGLAENASFLDQGIIESTGVLELVTHLETAYGIKVRDEEMIPQNLDSINAIAAYLEKKIPARNSVA
jgi:acyl carrier protein